jgi:hypothetical protein
VSTIALPIAKPKQRAVADRRFYLTMAVACAVLIFVGFARSYFLKFHFPLSPKLSLLVHIHGAVFTAWVLYFVLQTALIAVRKPALHISLGLLGAVLGATMIVVGLAVAFTAMRLGHGSQIISAETTFLIGLIDISTFGAFFILGWLYRRNREAHQRLMLLAVVGGLLSASFGRIVGYGAPIPVVALVNLAFIFAGPFYDFITRRRIHPVYIYGCLYLLATFTPLRFAVGATPAWHHIAHALVGR